MGRFGGTRVLFEVGNRLERRGHSVTFTTLGYPGEESWFPLRVSRVIYAEKKFRLPGIRYTIPTVLDHALSKFNLPYVIDRIRVLAHAMPQDIDVNVATLCFTGFAVYRSGKGTPFYYVQHFEPLFFSEEYLRNMALESYYLNLSKLVTSKWLEKVIVRLTKEQPILVGNGVNNETFYPRRVNRFKHPVVSIIARGIPWKGDKDVFEALSIVTKKIPDVRLRVTGDLHTFEQFKRTFSRIKSEFVPTPTDEELAKFYSSSDVFVLASWYEGFSLPPLEAMACGTPVVSTDNLGIRDYGIDGWNAVISSPPRNPETLAAGIMKVLRDDALVAELKKNGLQTAREFSFERVVDKLVEAFRSGVQEIRYTPTELISRTLEDIF